MAATYRKLTSSRHSESARSVPPTNPSLASTGKGNITLNVLYRLAFALARQSSTQWLTPSSGSSPTILHHCSPSLPGRLLERCRAQFTSHNQTALHHSRRLPLSGYSHCHGQNARPKPSSSFPWRRTQHRPVRGPAAADKLRDIKDLLQPLLGVNHTTYGFLETFLGKLSFASRVVVPGRMFTRRLWDLKSCYHQVKAHYRVKIPAQCRHDLLWWQVLLEQWNRRTFFLNPGNTPATDLGIYSGRLIPV